MIEVSRFSIDGNTKPSGPLRWTHCVRFRGDNAVGIGRELVCKVDEVFRPELEQDGSFVVHQFDADERFAAVVDDPADFYVAVGRYLDPVHGGVVASFVRPASPDDRAAIMPVAAPLSPGKGCDPSRADDGGEAGR